MNNLIFEPTVNEKKIMELVQKAMPKEDNSISDMKKERTPDEGLRHNEGKLRYDLLEPFAIRELVRVFTLGAEKYAPYNWLKGMAWSKMIASLKRHIAAFEDGEDFDQETKCFHMAHAAWNALGLLSFYKYHPGKDDRQYTFIPKPKIALDIDEVLAGFVPAWCKKFNLPIPEFWSFDNLTEKFEVMKKEGTLDQFYADLEPVCSPTDIPFEPHCYITSRPVDTEITEKWLNKHGFPRRPVVTIPHPGSKIESFKVSGADILIDDRYETFEEFTRAGLCCYLMDQPHNRRYNVGYKRISSLKDVFKTVL